MNTGRDFYEDEEWLNYVQNNHYYQKIYDRRGFGGSKWRKSEG